MKILVVDDQLAHFKLIEVFLAASIQFETDITYVSSLEDSLNAILTDDYDVVLLDLYLGDSKGLETLERFFEVSPNSSVIVFVGNEDKNMGIKAIRKGAQDALRKDHLDTTTLAKAVMYANERKKLLVEV